MSRIYFSAFEFWFFSEASEKLLLSELAISDIVIFEWVLNETGIFNQPMIFPRGLKWIKNLFFSVGTKSRDLPSCLFTEKAKIIDFQLDS